MPPYAGKAFREDRLASSTSSPTGVTAVCPPLAPFAQARTNISAREIFQIFIKARATAIYYPERLAVAACGKCGGNYSQSIAETALPESRVGWPGEMICENPEVDGGYLPVSGQANL